MTADPFGQLAVLPDPSGLLAAILANPESDLERLLYADWLDEQAGHETERAAYIRAFINIVKLDDDDSRPAAVRLYFSIFESLLGPFGRDAHLRMDRGFIRHLSCSWPAWVAHGSGLREREWVPEVTFRYADSVMNQIERVERTARGTRYRIAGRVVALSTDELRAALSGRAVAELARVETHLALEKRWPGTRFTLSSW